VGTPALEVVGLRKAYARDGRTLEVLDLARLSVADGEFVTVVGPSGCGKSTLLHILGGFIPANTGEIRVHGREVVGPGPDRGMVFQEFSLFPWRTVGGNVGWGLEVRGAPASKRATVVDRYLELTGLSEFRNHLPSELSGGMKQRVALARVLAFDPEVLLMGERNDQDLRDVTDSDPEHDDRKEDDLRDGIGQEHDGALELVQASSDARHEAEGHADQRPDDEPRESADQAGADVWQELARAERLDEVAGNLYRAQHEIRMVEPRSDLP